MQTELVPKIANQVGSEPERKMDFSSSHPPKLINLTKYYKQLIALLYQKNSF